MTTIRLNSLTKRFGEVTAVSTVDLDIAGDDLLVLLGPSGCGKTTLLRLIAGLIEPTEGRITVGERDITRLPPRERDLAMVFQSYALYPHLTVERNLGFGLGVRRTPRAEVRSRVREVAALLDLEALRPGAEVTVSADPAQFHLFDRTSGHRLVWTTPELPAATTGDRVLAGTHPLV